MSFQLVKKEYITGVGDVSLYEHEKSGAQILHVKNTDQEKVFGVVFRTFIKNSKGLPHIIEHSVLSGSKKFEFAGETFTELLKSSIASFINAMTYPDKTVYPVASVNEKDLYNLATVYLDAVFNPLLKKEYFMKEGWHYEFEGDKLIYKGVVFNEMKGAMSSPERVLYHKVLEHISPDTMYRFNSGGDPEEIVNLSYDEYLAYYKKYYHPSNALIFLYGNSDFKDFFGLIDEYVGAYTREEKIDLDVPYFQKTLDLKEKKYIDKYQSTEDKYYVTYNVLLDDITDTFTFLSLHILVYYLIGDSASVLRRKLVESGLGDDFVSGTDRDDDMFQMILSAGLKGVSKDNIDKVADIVREVIDEQSKGVDTKGILSALNFLEFKLKEKSFYSEHDPKGINLLVYTTTAWLYRADVFSRLNFNKYFQEIKEKVKQGGYFEYLINKYLVKNPHKMIQILEPDAHLMERYNREEEGRLTDILQNMTEEEKQEIKKYTDVLKNTEKKTASSVPSLKKTDLDREANFLESKKQGRIYKNPVDAEGLVYAEIGFDLSGIRQDLIPFIPLFFKSLIKMNKDRSYTDFLNDVGIYTGGISAKMAVLSKFLKPDESVLYGFLTSKSLIENAGKMFSLFKEALFDTNFSDKERFKQILLEEKSVIGEYIINYGTYFAITASEAGKYYHTYLEEQIAGISYYKFLQELSHSITDDWDKVYRSFLEIRDFLFTRSKVIYNITSSQDDLDRSDRYIEDIDKCFDDKKTEYHKWILPHNSHFKKAYIIDSHVNYVVKGGFSVYDYDRSLSSRASLFALANYLRYEYLWNKIRIQGGAYGPRIGFNLFDGLLFVGSYRDPNIISTIQTIDSLFEYISNLDLPEEKLDRIIISAIGDYDRYLKPSERGWTAMLRSLSGITREMRQEMKDNLFDLKLQDIKKMAEVFANFAKNSNLVVLGSKQSIEEVKDKAGFDDIEVVKKDG